ncbi:molybdopterin-dependent oxidoreductase [Gordonia polyisoprenivorans]|uniref:molybdopterin-dependent oxidoreductase n=1 Tax=Gordonia polyisoprenivorans TaxID=84595 RepID=UPI001B8BE377|nr:molybdopterin-dependent oxidoreductase [Gordonia polyisoprenivorans]QUD82284.1 molybdopterin-dependent oxidoreductase [Gordonia polyisoprenivorans]WCB37970.1 molybdopterin-dependent oxidoreductase [Gordonia polyisoprenivorans]
MGVASGLDPDPDTVRHAPGRRVPVPVNALTGIIAVAAALGAGELVAAFISPESSPYFAVGSSVVDHSPLWMREWAISTFGTSDKLALFVVMGVVIAILAGVCGLAERRRPPIGSIVIVVFAIVGVVASLGRPGASATYMLPSLFAGAAGVIALRILVGILDADAETARAQTAPSEDSDDSPGVLHAPASRRFVLTAAGIAAAAVAVGALGRTLLAGAAKTIADRNALRLPAPASPAPPVPASADIGVPGATPFVTGNADFYRIDTALQVPQLTTGDWQLRVHGMVDNEFTLSWDDLLAMPMTERLVTLTCVSNEVGGDLIGNARWLGVRMKDLLDRAGVRPGANMLYSTSSDGWTCGTPVSAITDNRDALLAIGMNGQPLPVEHGYPVRQVIPGLYGYVSATKWVVDWELTSFDKAQAYWTSRGWSQLGPIKISSRIDRPSSSDLPAGQVVLAGTSWHQHTGIAGVEVRIDDGPWEQATLATDYSDDTWRPWKYVWQAGAGQHTVTCRAIGKDGQVQTSATADPVPDGATGLDSRTYSIS